MDRTHDAAGVVNDHLGGVSCTHGNQSGGAVAGGLPHRLPARRVAPRYEPPRHERNGQPAPDLPHSSCEGTYRSTPHMLFSSASASAACRQFSSSLRSAGASTPLPIITSWVHRSSPFAQGSG